MYRTWGFTLVLVPCVAVLSAVVLIAQYIFISCKVSVRESVSVQVDGQSLHKSVAWMDRVVELGGRRILAYKAARLVTVVALLVIAVMRIHWRTTSVLSMLICATYVGRCTVVVFCSLIRDIRRIRLC